jgi:hypothetical protein
LELALGERAGLVAVRADRIEADCEDVLGLVDGLGPLPLPLELVERAREPAERGPRRDVVVARDDEQRASQVAEEAGRALVLVTPAPVREVAARDHELRIDELDQRHKRTVDRRLFARSDVQV